jgi:hypothetical protein
MMNLNIEQLEKQCWNYQTNHLDARKFAKRIVEECMRMCDVAAVGYETHGHTKEANGCYSAKEYIEEHFGVEE